MDLKELKEILQILEEKEITEFELEEQGMKLRIRKAASGHAAPPAVALSHAPAVFSAPGVPAAVPGTPAAPPATGPAEPPAPAEDEWLSVVKSPIVGTFYRTPDPNSPPFVSVGDRVRVGQVLCIIEAMKLMNEIESEVAGIVTEVLASDAQPVEYGQPLFRIDPNG